MFDNVTNFTSLIAGFNHQLHRHDLYSEFHWGTGEDTFYIK